MTNKPNNIIEKLKTLIILADTWAVIEIMIYVINYKTSVVYAEQLHAL
jgi:hypothetical protein